jgi:hypothetical protein
MTQSRQVLRQIPSKYEGSEASAQRFVPSRSYGADVLITAVIHVFCETNPSLGTAIVNGLLAWATVLGACTAFFSGLPAALFARDATPAHVRADLINRGMGIGFRLGMLLGPLMFFVFIAKIAS